MSTWHNFYVVSAKKWYACVTTSTKL